MSYFDIYESRGHGIYPEGVPLDGDEFVTPEDTEAGMDVSNPNFDKKVELALQKSRAVFVVNSASGKRLGQIISFDSRYECRVPEEDESLKDDKEQGEETMLIARSIAPTMIGSTPEDRIGESKDVIIGDEQSIQDSGISDIEVKNGNGDTMAAAGPDVIAEDPGAPTVPTAKAEFPFMTIAVAAGLGFLLLKMLKK
uniref:Uncharacterized protein n=1 Tax=viral metagenome TaxID=1070528 RepID=A0A6M3XT88_9ZZZZ